MHDERTLPFTVAPATEAKLSIRKVRLEVVRGPDQGLVVDVAGTEARIGSGKTCDLVLRDPTVSRMHLLVRVEGDAIRVSDAGSRNGTLLDNIRVADAWARPDSTITIGATTLRLRMSQDMAELPLSRRDRLGGLIGQSIPMRRIFALLERIAPTDTTVLVEGETGTGKELVAEALHDESPRAKGAFIVFDCSAASATLIESELFGHVRGSFTGATGDRPGAFEAANGGTLFLDEIGELPLDLQPKLLRALENREVRRVGSNTAHKVDVRIVAATNRSLVHEVDRGRFREDLYYRLAVVPVRLPPLRERLGDVPLLVRHFEEKLRRPGQPELPESVVDDFCERSWPGNVRELRNAVARAISIGTLSATPPGVAPVAAPVAPPASRPGDAALAIDLSEPLFVGRERVAEAFEREYLAAALKQTGGNVSRAAEIAGVNRKFIQRAMKRFGSL
ncbi:MAG: sigma 54-interacting transcriptional regulator [Polyangiaceae bacterium]|nr:sigma 54-interacting transcriptional regulator [Polyangiaceae bacterium]